MLGNNIKETTTTTSTGAITLAGAVSGFNTFASQFADDEPVHYTIFDGNDYETGVGIFNTAGPTITRPAATILEKSVSGTVTKLPGTGLTLAAGSKEVSLSVPAQSMIPGLQVKAFTDYHATQFKEIKYPTNVGLLNANESRGGNAPIFYPALFLQPVKISKIGMVIQVADAATTDNRVAIYRSLPDGGVGELIIGSGHISGAATGVIFEAVTAFVLPAGIYFFCHKNDGTTLKLAGHQATEWLNPTGARADTNAVRPGVPTAGSTVGAFPQTITPTGAEHFRFAIMGYA